jgi:serine/threonine-protein kinase
MGFCDRCQKSYPGMSFCPEHGVQLLQAAPRPGGGLGDAPSHSAPTQFAGQSAPPEAAGALPLAATAFSSAPQVAKEEAPKPAPNGKASVHEHWIGQVMGNFRLTKLLGAGGMGAVYLAEHKVLPKRAAVKLLKREFAALPEVSERFQREAESAVKIAHENIVQILDFGQRDDGTLYLVMELLEGTSLSGLLKSKGAIPPDRVYSVLRPICLGLAAAHDLGIIHRDLKPDNIFLSQQPTPEGRSREVVKILDFGIAKITSGISSPNAAQTGTGMILGTPFYMSPEQAEGGKIDFRSDIYSLGVILYEMFTGRVPFTADTFGKILLKHIGEAPVPPRQARPDLGITPALDAFILKCLAKNPEDRPADARALLALFEEAAGAQQSPDGGIVLTLPKHSPTRGTRLALGAALALVLGVGAYALFLSGEKPRVSKPSVVAKAPSADEKTPATPEKATLQIVASPDAQVFNASETIALGKTPFTAELPASGELRLVLKADGYSPYPLSLRAEDAAKGRLEIPLQVLPVASGEPEEEGEPSKEKDPGKKPSKPNAPKEPDKKGLPAVTPPKETPANPVVTPPKEPDKKEPPVVTPPKEPLKKDPPKVEEGGLVDPFGGSRKK